MSCLAHETNSKARVLADEDIDQIRELTRMLPLDRRVFVVDIGAGRGVTALSVFAERADDIIIWAIDHNRELLRQRTATTIAEAGFQNRWIPLVQKSDDTEFWLSLRLQFDLILIDADHSYESVRNDISAWLPYAQDGAFFWFHDYGDPREHGFSSVNLPTPGVKQAVEEAVGRGELVEIATRGLGWAGSKVHQ